MQIPVRFRTRPFPLRFARRWAAAIAAGAALAAWVVFGPRDSRILLPAEVRWAPYEQTLGDAPAALLAYLDFRCIHCARFVAEALPALSDAYVQSGRLRLVFRPAPFLSGGEQAAQAALCAAHQSEAAFWRFAEVLAAWRLRSGAPWDTLALAQAARMSGADPHAIRACLDRGEPPVQWARELAHRDGIRATPTFVLGGRRYLGFADWPRLAAWIEEGIADAATHPVADARGRPVGR